MELYLRSHTAQLHGEVAASVADANHEDTLSPESLWISVFLAVEVPAFEAGLDT